MKILALRLSSAGDIVLLLPALEEIKASYPDAEIVCLAKPAFAGLVRGCPAVSRVVEFDGLWNAWRTLSKERWDAVLDFHGVPRTRVLAALLPARWKATYRKSVVDRYRLLWGAKGVTTAHVADRYREMLKSLGLGVKRVAVLQTALLGDAVLTIPLLRAAAERFKPDHLVIITKPELAFVFEKEGFPVIKDDKHGVGAGPLGFWRLARRLRAERFDAAVVPHRSLRSAALAWAAGIPLRAGFDNSTGRAFFNRVARFDHAEHDSERNQRLLDAVPAPAHGTADDGEFRLRLRAEDRRRGVEQWRAFGADPEREFIVGLAPGASRVTKKWLPERFAETARRLRAAGRNRRIALIGGPGERALCAEVAAAVGGDVLDLSGKSRLEDLPGLLAGLKLFVTNDSGPMHIAYGVGVPTVAVFGPTIKEFGFYPKGRRSRLVETDGLPCRPCGLHGTKTCPEGHFLCMRLVTVEQVLAACSEVLAMEDDKCPS